MAQSVSSTATTEKIPSRAVRIPKAAIPLELDRAEADRFELAAREVVDRVGPDIATVVVDMAQVDIVDSSGVRALIRLKAAARERGLDLWLVNPKPIVQRVLEVLGLTEELVRPAS